MTQPVLLLAFGGTSPEHEVSVITAMQIASELEQTSYNIRALYVTKEGKWLTGTDLLDLSKYQNLKELEKNSMPCYFSFNEMGQVVFCYGKSGLFSKEIKAPIYCVFPAFHGGEGENGAFQGLCEYYNIPYVGSGVAASSIGMDKDLAKRVCKETGIPTVPGFSLLENDWIEHKDSFIEQAAELGFPLFIKPARLGSSIGIERCSNSSGFVEAVETAFRFDQKLIVEKAVYPLKEINCSVLSTGYGLEVSVLEQPNASSEEILSFQDKYQGDNGKGMASASRIIPAPISDVLTEAIQQTSQKVYRALGCSGLVRIDYLMDTQSDSFFFNEINTIPGSLAFYLWNKSGFTFNGLIETLIKEALDVHRRKNGRVRSYETNLLSEKSVKGIKGLKGIKK